MAALEVSDFETTRGLLTALAGNRAPDLGTSPVEIMGELIGVLAQSEQSIGESFARASTNSPPSSDTSAQGLASWAVSIGLPNGAGDSGPRGATAAQGATAYLTGDNTTVYPLGQKAQATGGVTLAIRAGVTIPGASPGTGQVLATWDVDSTDAGSLGAKGNLTRGTLCTLVSPPAGSDSTFTIDTEMAVLGQEAETEDEVLLRIQGKMQRPPNGGNGTDHKEWVEGATDASGAPITSAQVVPYVYPNYYGPARHLVVATLAGSGQSRAPDAATIAKLSTAVNGTVGTDGKRLAGVPVSLLTPYMPASRGLVLTCRCLPSLVKFAADWIRGATIYQVNSFSVAGLAAWVTDAGGNAMIEFDSVAPVSLREAIDAGLKPRLYVDCGTTAAFLGPVVPEQAPCLAWRDVAGIRTQVALSVSNATNWALWVQATNEIYAGGPIVAAVGQNILDAVDGRGPSRVSGFADPAVSWQDTISITTVSTAAETALDADGITRLVDRTVTGGVGIDIGPARLFGVSEVRASDNTINGPEILWAGRILVTD